MEITDRNESGPRGRARVTVFLLAVLSLLLGALVVGPSAVAQDEEPDPRYTVHFLALDAACDPDDGYTQTYAGFNLDRTGQPVYWCALAGYVPVDNEPQCTDNRGTWDDARGVCLFRKNRPSVCESPAILIGEDCWVQLLTDRNLVPEPVCEAPAELIDGECVTPVICEAPAELIDGECVTPIICEAPAELIDGECVIVNPVCAPTAVVIDGKCVIPITCEAPAELINDECVTPVVCEAPAELINDECVTPTPTCEAPAELIDGECVDPDDGDEMEELEVAPAGKGKFSSLSPVCADSDMAQDKASTLQVGAIFADGSHDYLIVTGNTCDFNCHDGWDANCDGKLGDFCRSEYDLRMVADIGKCMADHNVDSQAAPS